MCLSLQVNLTGIAVYLRRSLLQLTSFRSGNALMADVHHTIQVSSYLGYLLLPEVGEFRPTPNTSFVYNVCCRGLSNDTPRVGLASPYVHRFPFWSASDSNRVLPFAAGYEIAKPCAWNQTIIQAKVH